MTYAGYETLAAAGPRARAARAGRCRRCARSRTRASSQPIRRAAADHERDVRAARRSAVRRPHGARPRRLDRGDVPRARRRRALLRHDRRVRPERRAAARGAGRPRDRRRRDDRDRCLADGRRLLLRLHAHVRDRRPARGAAPRLRRLPRPLSRPALAPIRPGTTATRRRRGGARRDRARRASARRSATASGTASASSSTRLPFLNQDSEDDARGRERRHLSSRGSTLPGSAASGSRTS